MFDKVLAWFLAGIAVVSVVLSIETLYEINTMDWTLDRSDSKTYHADNESARSPT